MTSTKLHKKLLTVIICLATIFVANAQTASSLADLQTKFAAAVATGVPTTISIASPIVINVDLQLVSTGDSITLNFTTSQITVTAGTLTIGNKVKITSTLANSVQALVGGTVIVNAGSRISSNASSPITAAGGNVIINGGKISTSNLPAASAGLSGTITGGMLTINGGYLYTSATGTARGVAVDYLGTCIVNGGEIHSDMGGGRGISINGSGGGGKLYVNGGIISAAGAGRAIQLDNANSAAWISGSPTITGGLEAIMVQKNGVVVISGAPTITGVIGTNVATAKLYDTRQLSAIVATPGAGTYAASQNVAVTGGTGTINKYSGVSSGTTQANYTGAGITPTTVASTLVYTTNGTNPVAASSAYSTPLTVAVPSVLNVAPLIDGTIIGVVSPFAFALTGQPFTAAPKPAVYDPTKVISIFSDAYTSVSGVDFNPGWGQNTVYSTLLIGGNNTIQYSNLNYQGMSLSTHVNAAAMTYLHVDIWSADETSFQITPISPATPNAEFLVTLTPLVQNGWNSFDIPLSAFTGVSMSDIFQFKVVGSGGKTVYMDNLYFYNNSTTVDTQAPTAFTATLGAVTYNSVALVMNGMDDSGALNYTITYGANVIHTGGASGTAKTYVVTGLNGSTDYSFSIVATDPTGNAAANNPIVIPATTLAPLAVPTVSAPTPVIDASKVMSVFSNAYTPLSAAIQYNPNWGQATIVTTFNVGTDATMKYDNFNYQGIDFAGTFDMSTMTKLHVDVFTPNETSITIQPISTPSGPAVALTPLALAAWNSFDIPLSSFTGLNKAGVFQVMFNAGSGGKIVYIDNIYFYNDVNTSVSSINGSSTIQCYPSRVLNTLNISANSEISNVIVRNLLGQTVKSVVVNSNQKSIDLSTVSAGNYLVTMKLANGQSTTQKIVKL